MKRDGLPVGVLVSGEGTNLQALLTVCSDPAFPARVAAVGCNRAAAPAVARARAAGIETTVVDRAAVPRRAERQRLLLERLRASAVELVLLAGFDEILAPEFLVAYAGRILNTHPSLLPAFGGTMSAVQRALDTGVKVTGCTVHFVTAELDAGPIVAQRCVEVRDDDTVETLHARIRAEEHLLVPAVVRAFAEGRLRTEGQRVHVLASPQPV